MKSQIFKRKKGAKIFTLATCLALTAAMVVGCGTGSSVQVESSVVNESVTTSMNAGELLVLSGNIKEGTDLKKPVDVCIDGSTLYVADRENQKVRSMNLDTNEVTDVVSDVDATALCTSRGGVYFADSKKGTVNLIEGNSYKEIVGDIGNVIGGMTSDETGNLYVCSADRHCIYEIDENGNSFVFAGTPKKSGYADGNITSALFYEPMDIAYYDGVLYVADSANNVIRQIKDGNVTTIAGSVLENDEATGKPAGGNKIGDETLFNYPTSLYVYNNVIIVSDTINNCIKAVKTDGTSNILYGGKDAGLVEGVGETARMNRPMGVVYDGRNLYLADSYNDAVRTATLDINSISYETIHSSTVYANRTVIIYSIDDNDGAKNIVSRGAEEIEAYEGMRLTAGDTVKTNDKGGLYIKVDNDKVLRLEPNSSVSITQANESKLTITLISGDLFFNVQEELNEYEEMSFIEGSITMSIRGTSGYFSHIESADNTALSLMLFDGKVSAEVSSVGGSEVIATEVLPGNTATVGTSGAASAGIIQEEYELEDIPSNVKEIIKNDDQLKERIIESISETRGIDKTEVEKEVNTAVENTEPETTTTPYVAPESPVVPGGKTEPEPAKAACGCLQSEVSKNPSAHEKCAGCHEYKCHGGDHSKYGCGCYKCVIESCHQKLHCGHYECEAGHDMAGCGEHCTCERGDHSLCESCGEYNCNGRLHDSLPCGHHKCERGNHDGPLPCGHYTCTEGDHTPAECGKDGHYNCHGNHGWVPCGHYECESGHSWAACGAHCICQPGEHDICCTICGQHLCQGHARWCDYFQSLIPNSVGFVSSYFSMMKH